MHNRILLSLVVSLFVLPSCLPNNLGMYGESYPLTSSWTYADLRAVDANDSPNPKIDLLAAYVREAGTELQLRLDFLELSELPEFDLYLALDTQPGGTATLPVDTNTGIEWDTLIYASAAGGIQSSGTNDGNTELSPDKDLGVRILRDPILDTLTITLHQDALFTHDYSGSSDPIKHSGSPFSFQVILTAAQSPVVLDTLGPVHSTDPPPQPAPVLFTFWNSYPAYTPALALRRWDGAHTGPRGGRHGLYNLLRTARNADVPLVLLDLNNPFSLSALEYIDQLDLIREMVQDQQLILPEALPPSNVISTPIPGSLMEQFHLQNQLVGGSFDLAPNAFLFSPSGLAQIQEWVAGGTTPNARLIFVPSPTIELDSSDTHSPTIAASNIYRWREFGVIPVPGFGLSPAMPDQATRTGPSIETRQALIQTALAFNTQSGSDPPILILGGELPASTWGVPQYARATFNYLKEHPWIDFLNAYDLLSASAAPTSVPLAKSPPISLPISLNQSQLLSELVLDLQSILPNHLTEAAWQALLALYAPVYPTPQELPALRSGYIGQLGPLISAAKWVNDPAPRADCSTDIDYDGQPECVLASTNMYIISEIEDSSLTYVFYLAQDGNVHQVIAPSSQFISGLSEPSGWEPGQGLAADPAVISGAFIDQRPPDQVLVEDESLTYTWAVGAVVSKTYSLLPQGMRVEYQISPGGAPVRTQLPLALDPWLRFSPGWADTYRAVQDSGVLTWEIEPHLYLTVQGSADMHLLSFVDSHGTMASPEDPNRDYPAGHFIPFPISLVELSSVDDFFIQIEMSR